MSSSLAHKNSLKTRRIQRGWSQEELSLRAGISRPAVSAIEGRRLTPAVSAALALARVLGCTVEELFGDGGPVAETSWAWPPPVSPWRFWQALINDRVLLYPVEETGGSNGPHDGVGLEGPIQPIAARTLVLATCDPAASILASEFARRTGQRLIVLNRSSRRALELLKQGLVHAAGIHFATQEQQSANEQIVRTELGAGYCLVRAAGWDSGVAVADGKPARSVASLLKTRLRWVGREPGSAARQCLDQLLPRGQRFSQIAFDHRGVAAALRGGWADAGVCVRLVSAEARLQFLPVQQDACDLCFAQSASGDPRIEALVSLLQSTSYQRLLGELPGYYTQEMGVIRDVQ